jgi:hypothetical protein
MILENKIVSLKPKLMELGTSFEILIRKKIPYWSQLLMGIAVVLFIFLFLLYLIMLPSEKASSEMRAAYYILVVPEWLKNASTYSFFGLLLLFPIYRISRSYKLAWFELKNDILEIRDDGTTKKIQIDSIRKIILNDINRFLQRPREATEIIIYQKSNKKTSFLLKYYVQSEELVEALIQYDTIEFKEYNGFELEIHDNED